MVFHGSLAQIKHSVGDFRGFGSILVVLVGFLLFPGPN